MLRRNKLTVFKGDMNENNNFRLVCRLLNGLFIFVFESKSIPMTKSKRERIDKAFKWFRWQRHNSIVRCHSKETQSACTSTLVNERIVEQASC